MEVPPSLLSTFEAKDIKSKYERRKEMRRIPSRETPLHDEDTDLRVNYILDIMKALAKVRAGQVVLSSIHRERLLFFLESPSLPILHIAGYSLSPGKDSSPLLFPHSHAGSQQEEGKEREAEDGMTDETAGDGTGGSRINRLYSLSKKTTAEGEGEGRHLNKENVTYEESEWKPMTSHPHARQESHVEDSTGEKILVEVSIGFPWCHEQEKTGNDPEDENYGSQVKPSHSAFTLFSLVLLKADPSATPITIATIRQKIQFFSLPPLTDVSSYPSSSYVSAFFGFLYLHSVHVLKPLLSAALHLSCLHREGGARSEDPSLSSSSTLLPPSSSCFLSVPSSEGHHFSSSPSTADFPPHTPDFSRHPSASVQKDSRGDGGNKLLGESTAAESFQSQRTHSFGIHEGCLMTKTSYDISSHLAGLREAQNALYGLEGALAFLSLRFSPDQRALRAFDSAKESTLPFSLPPLSRRDEKSSQSASEERMQGEEESGDFSPTQDQPSSSQRHVVVVEKSKKPSVYSLASEDVKELPRLGAKATVWNLSFDLPISCSPFFGSFPSTFLGFTFYDHLVALRSLAHSVRGKRREDTADPRLLGKDGAPVREKLREDYEERERQNAVSTIEVVLESLETPVENLLGDVHKKLWEEQLRAERLVSELLALRGKGRRRGSTQRRERKNERENAKTEMTASDGSATGRPPNMMERQGERWETLEEEEGLRERREEQGAFNRVKTRKQEGPRNSSNSFFSDLSVLLDRLEDSLQQLWSICTHSTVLREIGNGEEGDAEDGRENLSRVSSFSVGEAAIQPTRDQAGSPFLLPLPVVGSSSKKTRRRTALHQENPKAHKRGVFMYKEEDVQHLLRIIGLDLRAALENYLLRQASDEEERHLSCLDDSCWPGALGATAVHLACPSNINSIDDEIFSEVQEAVALCDKWLCARQHLLAVFSCRREDLPDPSIGSPDDARFGDSSIEEFRVVLKSILDYHNQQKAFHKLLKLDVIHRGSSAYKRDISSGLHDVGRGEKEVTTVKDSRGWDVSFFLELTGDKLKKGSGIPVTFAAFVVAAILSKGGKGGTLGGQRVSSVFLSLLKIAEEQMIPLEALTATRLKEEIFWKTCETDFTSGSDEDGATADDLLPLPAAGGSDPDSKATGDAQSTCDELLLPAKSTDMEYRFGKTRARETAELLRGVETHMALLSRPGVQRNLRLEREKALSDIRAYVHHITVDLGRQFLKRREDKLGSTSTREKWHERQRGPSTEDETESEEDRDSEEEDSSWPPTYALSSSHSATPDLLRNIRKCQKSLARVQGVTETFLKDLRGSGSLRAELEEAKKTVDDIGEQLFQVV